MPLAVSTALFAVADVVAVAVLARAIAPRRFRELRRWIVLAAAVFWLALATALYLGSWDVYYRYFVSESERWLFPTAAPFYAAVATILTWLATRAPFHPVLAFALLGAVESIPEHLVAIFRFGIMERVPMMADVGPGSILVFAFFEYALYWSLVLALAVVLRRLWSSALTLRRVRA